MNMSTLASDALNPNSQTPALPLPVNQATVSPVQTRKLPLVRAYTGLQLVRDPLQFLKAQRAQKGDIYTLDLGLLKLVMLHHPDQVQRVLIDKAPNYSKAGPMWDSIRTLLGNGLPVSEGSFWKQQRRMMQPHFHRAKLAALTDLMVSAIDDSLQEWDRLAEKQTPFNVEGSTAAITMQVIVRTMFGTGLSAEQTAKVNHLFPYMVDFLFKGLLTQSLPSWLPIPGKRQYRNAIAELDKIVLALVEQKRQEVAQNPDNASPDLLSTLIQMMDPEEGHKMSDQQLRDEAVSLFLAGYETTSTALSWGLYELTRRPDVVAKLQAEVDQQLQGRKPTFADLRGLPYTKMVLQELMRLYPPVWWMSRTAVQADEIDGFQVKAGSEVVPLTYLVHRHPDFWPDPERFDPERFTPEACAQRHHCAWIPFGMGQRQCIGKEFAMMEGQLILAQLLQRFDVSAVSSRPAIPKATTVLKSRNGIWLKLSKRTADSSAA